MTLRYLRFNFAALHNEHLDLTEGRARLAQSRAALSESVKPGESTIT